MDAKPLIIVIIFVLILAVIASGIIGNVDLTDSGRTQQFSAPAGDSAGGVNYDVFGGGSTSSSLPSAASGSGLTGGLTVSGKSTSPQNSPCGSTYTVQSGDTLSKISRTCLISLEDLLATNPSITNQHMISVGQVITIYRTLPVVTALPTALPTATLEPAYLPPAPDSGTIATLAPGLKPGDTVNVEVHGFPPGAQVRVGIARVGEIPANPLTVKTDPNGVLKMLVPIPLDAKAGEQWTVTITTVERPTMQVTAVPFNIGR